MLRRTSPELARPFRTPAVPLVPTVGAVLCLIQMVSLPGATWVRLFVWLALGFVVYFGYSRRGAAALRLAREVPRVVIGEASSHPEAVRP